MADLATAQKTLDALKKAYASGDDAKTASLLGTLKVRLATRGSYRATSPPGVSQIASVGRRLIPNEAQDRDEAVPRSERPRSSSPPPPSPASHAPISRALPLPLPHQNPATSSTQIAITAFPALPPVFEQTSTAKKELALARDVLEHAFLHAVRRRDDAAAERAHAQLRSYYADCAAMLPKSDREPLVAGLNLLRLLVQNRIAEFHVELELVSRDDAIFHSPHVDFAVALEARLMEGAYGSVLGAKDTAPAPDYAPFMDALAETVRDEIAACAEKAYATLDAKAARALLMASGDAEVRAVADARGWRMDAAGKAFVFREEEKPPSAKDIPAMQLIEQTMMYAKELERIV